MCWRQRCTTSSEWRQRRWVLPAEEVGEHEVLDEDPTGPVAQGVSPCRARVSLGRAYADPPHGMWVPRQLALQTELGGNLDSAAGAEVHGRARRGVPPVVRGFPAPAIQPN